MFSRVTMSNMIIMLIGLACLIGVNGLTFSEEVNYNSGYSNVSGQSVVSGVVWQEEFTLEESVASILSTNNEAVSISGEAVSGAFINPLGGTPSLNETTVNAATVNNLAKSNTSDAISGTAFNIAQNSIPRWSMETTAKQNEATSNESVAVSGVLNFFGDSNESTTIIYSSAAENTATANSSDAIAGITSVFVDTVGGSINMDTMSTLNNASGLQSLSGSMFYGGSLSDTDARIQQTSSQNLAETDANLAVSGVQTNVYNLSDTDFALQMFQFGNVAMGPQAIAGSQTNLNEVRGSTVTMSFQNTGNNASTSTGLQGQANAGYQMNVEFIESSSFSSNGYNTGNVANSSNASAIAGSDFNLGNISSTYLALSTNDMNNDAQGWSGAIAGSQTDINSMDNSTATIDLVAQENSAKADNGDAVAGIQNIIDEITGGSNLQLGNEALNNYAVVHQSGDAVAGVQSFIGNVSDSNVTMTNTAAGNTAKNYGTGDSISGTDTQIAFTSNANVVITNDARDNNAYAYYGDAIAGVRTDVLNATNNSTIQVSSTTGITTNNATSNNGTAVSDTPSVNINVDNTSYAHYCYFDEALCIQGPFDGSGVVVDSRLRGQSPVVTGAFFGGYLSANEALVESEPYGRTANTTEGSALSGAFINPSGVGPNVTEVSILAETANNNAIAREYDAFSGLAFAFDNNTVPSFSIEAFTTTGSASTLGGNAISGVNTLFTDSLGSDVNIYAGAVNNTANVNKTLTTNSSDSSAGVQSEFGTFVDGRISLTHYAAYNNGSSINASSYDTTVAGSNFEAGFIQDSDVRFTSSSISNKANADNGLVLSGARANITEVDNSTVSLQTYTFNNTAQGSRAVSGTEIFVGDAQDSSINLNAINLGNTAFNMGEDNQTVIAGSLFSVGDIYLTSLSIGGSDYQNNATSTSGPAIAGSMTKIGDIYNGNITFSIDDFGNYAAITSNETGVAIAGSQLSIGTISGTTLQGRSSLQAERENDRNNATVNNGLAIAGVYNIVKGVYNNSYVYIANEAENMTSVVRYDGTAIAGSETKIGVIEDSNVTIVNADEANIAKIYGKGDAIAGGYTYVMSLNNSNLNITSEALMNEAYAFDGDAIAGERVTIGYATNYSNVTIMSMQMLNEARVAIGTGLQINDTFVDVKADNTSNVYN